MSKAVTFALISAIAIVLMVLLRVAWIVFGRLDTVYAPGYSEPAFNGISVGLSCSDVETRLGLPLSTIAEPERQIWYYSKQANSRANYWNRIVFFDSNCRVSSVFKELNVD